MLLREVPEWDRGRVVFAFRAHAVGGQDLKSSRKVGKQLPYRGVRIETFHVVVRFVSLGFSRFDVTTNVLQ